MFATFWAAQNVSIPSGFHHEYHFKSTDIHDPIRAMIPAVVKIGRILIGRKFENLEEGARVIAASVLGAGSASVELFRYAFKRPPVTHKPPVGAVIVRGSPSSLFWSEMRWNSRASLSQTVSVPSALPRVPLSDTDLCAAHKRPSIIIFVLVSATWIML